MWPFPTQQQPLKPWTSKQQAEYKQQQQAKQQKEIKELPEALL
jgi:hypothetical protein